VTPAYEDANHEPTASLRGDARLSVRPGETVRLEGVVDDPDGDTVDMAWWQWVEVGTYPGAVSLSDPDAPATSATVPADAEPGQTIHMVLEATDRGAPPLTRYQRVVLTVEG
jgi:hypothetical protein